MNTKTERYRIQADIDIDDVILVSDMPSDLEERIRFALMKAYRQWYNEKHETIANRSYPNTRQCEKFVSRR